MVWRKHNLIFRHTRSKNEASEHRKRVWKPSGNYQTKTWRDCFCCWWQLIGIFLSSFSFICWLSCFLFIVKYKKIIIISSYFALLHSLHLSHPGVTCYLIISNYDEEENWVFLIFFWFCIHKIYCWEGEGV